jgi:hypothetical protein
MEFNIASLPARFLKIRRSGKYSKQGSTMRSISKFVLPLLLVCMQLSIPGGGGSVAPVQAQVAVERAAQAEITINTGKYQIPEGLLSALGLALGESGDRSGSATSFGVSYYEEHAHWTWIDLSVANGSYFDAEELGPSFLYFAVKDGDAWQVVFTGNNLEYLAVLDSISRAALSQPEIQMLDEYYELNQPNLSAGALTGDLLFPWSGTQNSWRFSPYGFHAAGFQSLGMEANAEAIDLLPPASAQPARVLAMQGGTVLKKLECTWNTVLIVRHDGYPDPKHFLYLHIQNGTSPVGPGTIIKKGQYLGDLRTPVYNGYSSNDSCATQGSGPFDCERDLNPSTQSLCSYSTGRHLHLGFGTDRNISIDGNVVANLVLGGNYQSTNQQISEVTLEDDFSGPTLNPRWHWVREDPAHWSLTEAPGYLRILTQSGDITAGANTAPLVLQSLQAFTSKDFDLQTRIVMTPAAGSQQGGLVIYSDDDNYVKLTYAYLGGPKFEFTGEIGGVPQSLQVPAPAGVNDFYLRITKLGNTYMAYHSGDGLAWTPIGTQQGPGFSPLEVGLLAFNGVNGTSTEIPADFDLFRIDEIFPTFSDVSSAHPYYPDIEMLYANGLTGGCSTNPLKFCPDQIMDRAQAAVFMMRGAYGSGYVPNPAANLFQDNWSKGTWARPWAESMRETGLTSGCQSSPLLYCPWVQLPREQAVIFALKMKYGNSYLPPAATGTVFADLTDPSYYATSWAEKAYADGLILSCGSSGGKPKICPTKMVTRGLGAYMIVRAKNLTMP